MEGRRNGFENTFGFFFFFVCFFFGLLRDREVCFSAARRACLSFQSGRLRQAVRSREASKRLTFLARGVLSSSCRLCLVSFALDAALITATHTASTTCLSPRLSPFFGRDTTWAFVLWGRASRRHRSS